MESAHMLPLLEVERGLAVHHLEQSTESAAAS
jgi:hypothetical protein